MFHETVTLQSSACNTGLLVSAQENRKEQQMAHALTLQLRKRLPHRAFNSANKQRGQTDIATTQVEIALNK